MKHSSQPPISMGKRNIYTDDRDGEEFWVTSFDEEIKSGQHEERSCLHCYNPKLDNNGEDIKTRLGEAL